MAILTTFITSIVEMRSLQVYPTAESASEKCCVTARTQKCRQKYSLKNRFRSHRRICCESIWSKRT